jgi:hypothetical protein
MRSAPANPDGRRPAGTTLRGAVLWAVVGAALLLGVGAALPMWISGPASANTSLGTTKVTLWEAAPSTRWQLSVTDELVLYTLLLLVGGTVTGLLGYFACIRIWQSKGGGA